ncbi:ATP-binding protein [Candidatus Binatia bacterium]|nr:ATP-binding protein [Candidatus Binatia bacterium]
MSGDHTGSWEEANQRYLSASLAWLRLRLLRMAADPGQIGAARAPAASRRGWWRRLLGLPPAQQPSSTASLSKAETVADAQIAAAAEAMNAAASTPEPPPALLIVGERLGLSRFERDVLLLCAAMDLDTRIAGLCARAQDDPARSYPTFALALALFEDPAWDVLSPQRPLRYWRLVEINQPGAQPLTASALRADERIVNYIKGLNHLDDRLGPFLSPLQDAGEAGLPGSQQEHVKSVTARLRTASGSPLPIIQLLGADGASNRQVATAAAAALGLQLYRLPVELLPAHLGELETLMRLWEREAVLSPAALYVDVSGLDTAPPETQTAALQRLLGHSRGVLFLDTREMSPLVGAPAIAVEVRKPAAVEQEATWAAVLGGAADGAAAQLAAQFDLSLPAIAQIAAAARNGEGAPADFARLWQACVVHTRPQIDRLAQRIGPKATWEGLVLPAEEIELLRAVCDQVRRRHGVYEQWGFRRRMSRGLGISALFAGESGTGKTMAAEVIANELQLDLYRIDLSAVVSKYIGETEKNLRRLFDAAEGGGAMLFFDEADALFGKRSEVKDSHDRYANIEINYLLQRMEAYRGLAILATNMKSALDPAFLRRLRFIVNFPYPGTAERKLIWQKAFPPETPVRDIDCERLARLNLTGGSIANIALNAAFLAARAGTPVTMALVLNAARAEFRKLERSINEADFRYLEAAAGGA